MAKKKAAKKKKAKVPVFPDEMLIARENGLFGKGDYYNAGTEAYDFDHDTVVGVYQLVGTRRVKRTESAELV